jgi:hypothetical protein
MVVINGGVVISGDLATTELADVFSNIGVYDDDLSFTLAVKADKGRSILQQWYS